MKGRDDDRFLPIDVGKVPGLGPTGAAGGEKVRGGEEQRPDLVGQRPTVSNPGLERRRNN
jgi:hypothetical protein